MVVAVAMHAPPLLGTALANHAEQTAIAARAGAVPAATSATVSGDRGVS